MNWDLIQQVILAERLKNRQGLAQENIGRENYEISDYTTTENNLLWRWN